MGQRPDTVDACALPPAFAVVMRSHWTLALRLSAFEPRCWQVLGSFAFIRPPTRCGRLMALHSLRQPEAFAFMVSYAERDGSRHAHALGTMLSRAGASVWLDTYRLENAFNLKQAVFCAARDAGFVVPVVTPRYLLSPNRCLELLAALRRPREQVFAWIDSAADWAGTAAQLELQGDMCTLVREWLAGQGFRVATTSMSELIRALDEALMSQEEHHVSGGSAPGGGSWCYHAAEGRRARAHAGRCGGLTPACDPTVRAGRVVAAAAHRRVNSCRLNPRARMHLEPERHAATHADAQPLHRPRRCSVVGSARPLRRRLNVRTAGHDFTPFRRGLRLARRAHNGHLPRAQADLGRQRALLNVGIDSHLCTVRAAATSPTQAIECGSRHWNAAHRRPAHRPYMLRGRLAVRSPSP